MEYYKIIKVGGANNPYACMQWPGIQIPQAITNLLDTKDLLVNFIDDNGETDQHYIQFYERNPTGKGLDFDDATYDKSDFVRYAVEIRCQNPITDTKKTPLSPLEELTEATEILLVEGLKRDKPPRKDLIKIQRTSSDTKDWFPTPNGPCNCDLRLNAHLGAGGVMTTCKI